MKPESNVDVLIIGAGPAGMMMAAWMARCGIKTRIVDKRGTKIFNGQADGLHCRTLEIFDSFGFADRAWRESNHILEVCFWNPDASGNIVRSSRVADTIPGISRFQQVVLNQGRIERFFLDMLASESDIRVERGVLPTEMHFDEALAEDADAYPVTVTLRHLSEAEATPAQVATSGNGVTASDGLFRSNLAPDDTADLLAASQLNAKADTTEVVKAKYVLGADGAHSWVRRQLGFTLEGETTDYIWGVMDIVPITDFPDIRQRCAIHSAESGSIMIIPREKKLVRLYCQLTTTEKNADGTAKRVDRSKITPAAILAAAQRILAPYTLTYRQMNWWTAYQIGQRVGTHFSAHERVFLAGDAVHTHSPKAGQGMNVSMQDAYNLGWKVASVVKGTASRAILKSYEEERSSVAHDLIRFDHRFSRLFSGRPAKDVMDEEGVSPDEFRRVFENGNRFASGTAVNYNPSLIVAKSPEQAAKEQAAKGNTDTPKPAVVTSPVVHSRSALATGLQVGARLPSVKVLNQADARPWHIQERLPSNGTWRIVLFVGDLTQPARLAAMRELAAQLAAPNALLRRFTPAGARYDAVIEVLTVHAGHRTAFTVLDFPEVLRPFDELDGWDYNKIFVDDQSYHEGHGELYKNYGIDPACGAVVALRPDQHVAYIGAVDDYASLDTFFSGFMLPQTAQKEQKEQKEQKL